MNEGSEKRSAGEHILVCVSPSPSNPKVVAAAANMAAAFQARLTAVYVKPSDYDALSEADKKRLQSNISFAEENGASISTLIGDDVPTQVAEFAHVSNATKLVVGRSGMTRRHFWSKAPLTEQIISNAPDLDVYIIPDSAVELEQHKERARVSERLRPTLKDVVLTLLFLIAATGIGLLLTRLGFSEANIITVFILFVLGISVVTVSPFCGVAGSLASVLLFNWFFVLPRFSFHTYKTEYIVTFAVMLLASLITGTLANRMKRNARQSAREAFRTKVLLDTNQLLQKTEKPADVLGITVRQIITLLNRDLVVYPRGENDHLGRGEAHKALHATGNADCADANEREIAEWVFYNQQAAGFRMERFRDANEQYLPICLNDYCYGLIAVRLNGTPLEPFENSIVMSILGECALALESLRNAKEKEQVSAMVRNEQLRSNILRSISHDIRTPLTSISGNASNLLHHYRQLDEDTLLQTFFDIYDDSEWLIGLVENLLSVSRIENGKMELHLSTEVLSDVVEEALKHVDRNASQHQIEVQNAEELLLVDMDSRLIMQVLINLINNAVKNTPVGSEIMVRSEREGDSAVISVCDNGPGIPEDIKPYVFDMFFTGKNEVADGRRGMGLGLALCKSIVEAHNGKISLFDNEPNGCRFVVSLPLKEVQVHE